MDCRPTDLSNYYLAFNGRLGRLAMDYELAIRGLLSMKDALKSGETGYPHTSIHDAAAGGGSSQPSQPTELVQGLEAAAGGSPQAAARQAVQSGLEPPMQAAAAAAAGRKDTAGAPVLPQRPAAGSSTQGKVNRVLMGHSLGGACAALEFINNPQDYAAVVLVDPAIIAGLGGPGEKDRPNDPVKLEKLQDGTAFTHSLASGELLEPQAAAAAAAGSSGSNGSSSTASLDQLAAEQGNLARSSSTSSYSTGSSSDSDSPTAAVAGAGSAAAKGADVVFYATRGDDATFAKLIKQQQEAGRVNAAVKLLTNSIGLIRSFVMLTTVLALSVLRPVIVVLLRVAVRSRKFWANTLEQVGEVRGVGLEPGTCRRCHLQSCWLFILPCNVACLACCRRQVDRHTGVNAVF